MKVHSPSSSKQEVDPGVQFPCSTALSAEDPGPKAQQPEKLSKISLSQLTAPVSGQQFMPTMIVKHFAAP